MSSFKYNLSKSQRIRRRFGEEFKIKRVKEIESGQVRPCEIVKEYQVSYQAIYKWINKYGMSKDRKQERLIVESQSDTSRMLALRKKIAELERTVGQKQIELDFAKKIIELAEDYYKIDIKKKFTDTQSDTTGKNGKS